MTFPVKREGRELLRMEVLDVRLNGMSKFRLWLYNRLKNL